MKENKVRSGTGNEKIKLVTELRETKGNYRGEIRGARKREIN